MKVRIPKNEEYLEEEIGEDEDEDVLKFDSVRSLYPSDDLPPLPKYSSLPSGEEKDKWIMKALPHLRAYISEGMTAAEIKTRLNISDFVYDRMERILYETDATRLSGVSASHHYYVYMLRMEHAVRQLDVFIRQHMDDPSQSSSGVVSAIKAKAQICKDMIGVGQDLGIVSRKAKSIKILGDINLSTLKTPELRDLLYAKMKTFAQTINSNPSLPPAFNQMLDSAFDNIDPPDEEKEETEETELLVEEDEIDTDENEEDEDE